MINRAIIIVLDGVGIGELPDSAKYNDSGADTLGAIAEKTELRVPNMAKLGLGRIRKLRGVSSGEIKPKGVESEKILGCFGKMAELSAGKDTTIGHWEIAGLVMNEPFPTYPDGFPQEIVDKFKEETGYDIIPECNKPYSGTEAIKNYGEEHMRTKKLIVYTSADSVFQIAAHEKVVPLEELYTICKKARNILTGKHRVARVIARPFVGTNAQDFKRTPNRKDYSVSPPEKTLLDKIKEKGLPVVGIGKIDNIFNGQGLTKAIHTKSNLEGIQQTISSIKEDSNGLIFTNLVDYDMLYGHRKDPKGFSKALTEFDNYLPELMDSMRESGLLIITSDHGCDPVLPGTTDHTREYVPLLVYGKELKRGKDLGTRKSFADVGKTLGEAFNVKIENGESFLREIL